MIGVLSCTKMVRNCILTLMLSYAMKLLWLSLRENATENGTRNAMYIKFTMCTISNVFRTADVLFNDSHLNIAVQSLFVLDYPSRSS